MGADYAIYVEDYVLSYLKRELDSLELSEIFFYGKRQNASKKLLVYGAGREKEIAVFAKYELLDELVCRLTQAGPVFMVRQENGEYKVTGFQAFYENNEAMQNYLIAWTGGEGERRAERELNWKRTEPTAARETAVARTTFEPEGKKRAGSAMSVQLGLILVVLAAIVISSANSYDKMDRLNRSAREVFFAIENQEAGQESGLNDATNDMLADGEEERRTEILVQRDTSADDISVEDAVRAENAVQAGADAAAVDSEVPDRAEDGSQAGTEEPDKAEDVQETDSDASVPTDHSDSSEEALSRNITRYYEVEQGDTLYMISQKIYGDASRVEKICEINQISDPDKIREGQKIILP